MSREGAVSVLGVTEGEGGGAVAFKGTSAVSVEGYMCRVIGRQRNVHLIYSLARPKCHAILRCYHYT